MMEERMGVRMAMVEEQSIESFMRGLIDYAGLFPPARLPLEEALDNFVSYRQSADSWMLGKFILPFDSLEELVELFPNLPPGTYLPLSLTRRNCGQLYDFYERFCKELQIIEDFNWKHGHLAEIIMFEIPLPQGIPNKNELLLLASLGQAANIKLFLEIMVSDQENWEQQLIQTLDVFAQTNSLVSSALGVKFRTGGLEAKMFPSPEKLSAFLYHCAERRLQIKFTAGLHHPVRMFRHEVGTKMHGFVNVFTAGLFAYAHQLNKEALTELLKDESPENFCFQPEQLSWKNNQITVQDIRRSRKHLFSYGSCSFDEPRDELRELHILKEA
ncbi:hypothetical protein V1499_18295 [Neobacillus sp. SCS-31]|uniref:hypothetical protein n=1 Tax=Neobacillus oceani TaxID=3115292 RepID=UPI003905D98B